MRSRSASLKADALIRLATPSPGHQLPQKAIEEQRLRHCASLLLLVYITLRPLKEL